MEEQTTQVQQEYPPQQPTKQGHQVNKQQLRDPHVHKRDAPNVSEKTHRHQREQPDK